MAHRSFLRFGVFILSMLLLATGGWGPNEGFVEPGSGALGESLHTTHASFETPCGSYGHFKAGRYLMRATGDSGDPAATARACPHGT